MLKDYCKSFVLFGVNVGITELKQLFKYYLILKKNTTKKTLCLKNESNYTRVHKIVLIKLLKEMCLKLVYLTFSMPPRVLLTL